MAIIREIKAQEIFDSRGIPTIECMVTLEDGTTGSSSVPSGASIGTYEALELRDNDQNRYNGQGVLKAIDNVNSIISKELLGVDAINQADIDRKMIELDGTPNKSKLGANAILSISQATVVAAAKSLRIPLYRHIRTLTSNTNIENLPIPMFNLIEGGKHANNILNFQEFLVIPATSKTFTEGLQIGVSAYQAIRKMMLDRGMHPLNADEGGFSPEVGTNEAAFTFLKSAIDQSGYKFSLDAFMGIDAAANSFFEDKHYRLIDRSTPYDSGDLVSFYQDLFTEYGLIYIEDPFAEDDLDGWKKMHAVLGEKTLIVGDDLTTTNPYRLEKAIEEKLIGGVIIKPNQIGTVTEAVAVAEVARFKNLKVIASHRSGETEDSFIADFAVGIGADYAKFGAPDRERMIKYNRMLEIYNELNQK